MADMIKFFKGLEASLPETGVNGALYITTDEGAIYLGTGTGMKRLGDFVQVANVASLPAKAHENCLYYCVAENILAKWNGAEWKQVNKQPTTEELKTLLGLGSMAYKSNVAEADLTEELAEKVNAAAEGNHAHANKTVLDGITAEKVTAWDAAEKNAKDHADGLNTAMNTRVEALEAIDHEHSNKALLDTYTQTEENLADAVAKKHEHSNKTELDKIAAGDVAKWNGVVADHLTSADKTALEDSIGDVNTALGEEVTRAKAAEKANADAITGIKNGTAINDFAGAEAELAKKVDKVDDKDLIATSEITRLAGMSDGANKVEASETNGNIKIDGVETVVYTHPDKHNISDVTGLQDALDAKVAKTDYEADKATFATKTELGDVDAKFANYNTTTVQKAIDDAQDARIKAIEDDYVIAADIADFETKENVKKVADDLDALETYVGTIPTDEKYADITNVVAYVNKKAEETLAAAQGGSSETAASVKQQLDNYKSENDTRVKAAEDAIDAIEADYLKAADKTELSDAIAAEKERAEGIEGGLRTDVDAIKGDYLKAADKAELEGKITTNANAIERLTNGVSADEVDGVNDLIQYVKDHGTEVTGMQEDIKENAEAIEAINNETTGILAQAKEHANGLDTAMDTRVKKLEAIDHDAYIDADATLKSEVIGTADDASTADTIYGAKKYAEEKASAAQSAAEATASGALAIARTEITAEIDADVKALADGQVKTNTEAIATKANSADVYAKTETYNKTEVDALFTWGSF